MMLRCLLVKDNRQRERDRDREAESEWRTTTMPPPLSQKPGEPPRFRSTPPPCSENQHRVAREKDCRSKGWQSVLFFLGLSIFFFSSSCFFIFFCLSSEELLSGRVLISLGRGWNTLTPPQACARWKQVSPSRSHHCVGRYLAARHSAPHAAVASTCWSVISMLPILPSIALSTRHSTYVART